MIHSLPDIEYLRECLTCDPERGKLFWRTRPPGHFKNGRYGKESTAKAFNATFAGKEAFTALEANGYRNGRIDNKTYKAHRVIWALVYGAWPESGIDHINGDPSDNRIANLRLADQSRNTKNAARRKDNTSGHTGVFWNKQVSRWQARLTADGATKHLGSFGCQTAAAVARKLAEPAYGFHRNHGRNS